MCCFVCCCSCVKNEAKVQLKLDNNQFGNEIIWKFENENKGDFKTQFSNYLISKF